MRNPAEVSTQIRRQRENALISRPISGYLEADGERRLTDDILYASVALSAMRELNAETISVRRKIVDRHGSFVTAIVEYSPTAFAAKFGDATARAEQNGALDAVDRMEQR